MANTTVNVNSQRIASIFRQLLGIVVSTFTAVTATTGTIHYPTWVAGVLTAFGPVILVIEHFLSDPSTGTTPPAPPAPPAA